MGRGRRRSERYLFPNPAIALCRLGCLVRSAWVAERCYGWFSELGTVCFVALGTRDAPERCEGEGGGAASYAPSTDGSMCRILEFGETRNNTMNVVGARGFGADDAKGHLNWPIQSALSTLSIPTLPASSLFSK